jgi:signal transduction histidine kinase
VSGWLSIGGILVGATAGVVLAVMLPMSAALVYPAYAVLLAAVELPIAWSVGLAVATSVGYLVGRGAIDGWTAAILIGPGAFAAGLLLGLIRRQSNRLTQERELAREEQARTVLLSERARLAREIHDVLAHALSALAVQLETADALLERGRVDQARRSVAGASQLAREGLAETRRAIGTLRGETMPLNDMLDALAAGYRTDLAAPASVRVEGEPHQLDADATLALYRTAQEAMTNVRKHAPGATVTIELAYAKPGATLTVVNGPMPAGADRPLVGTGGGYGLTGLRERAQLTGGWFEAGPSGDGYRVAIRIAR